MLPLHQPAKMRRYDRTDRTLVSGSVGVAADITENRASIQAGAAADAVQGVPLFGIRQQLSAIVIQQNQMEFLGTVHLIRLPRARQSKSCNR